MAPPPRSGRITAVTAIATFALASLSACISITADMTIDTDAKATGTLSLAFQKQAAGFLGVSSLADFEKGISSDDTARGLASLSDCAASENATAYVYACTFSSQDFPPADNAPWSIAREGDTIVMKVVTDGQAATGSPDLLGDASLGTLAISATFPGTITQVTGAGATQSSDDTVKIEASLTDAVDITVVSEASGAGPVMSVLRIVGIIVVVGVIALVVIVLLVRRRERRLRPGDGATGEAVMGDAPMPRHEGDGPRA